MQVRSRAIALFAMLGVSFVAYDAEAQLVRRKPLWRFSAPEYHRGLGSCVEARERALEIARLYCGQELGQLPGVGEVVDLGAQCFEVTGVGNPWLTHWEYRCTNHFPTTLNRGYDFEAYCDGDQTAPQMDAKGPFCPAINPDPSRVGCQDGCRVGNPITPGLGNKMEVEVDYLARGPFPLKMVRVYNSRAFQRSSSRVGANWMHNYAMHLGFAGPSLSNVQTVSVDWPDGSILYFAWNGTNAYVSDGDVPERLGRTNDGNWTLTTADDDVELYDSTGKLLSITNCFGLKHTLTYATTGKTQGFLEKVTDSFGRSLTIFIHPNTARLRFIQHHSGPAVIYGTSSDGTFNLLTKTDPMGAVRTYFYEYGNSIPNGLTGILDENGPRADGARYSTFWYDTPTPSTRGTAIYTQHYGLVGKVEVAYPSSTTRVVKEHIDATTTVSRTYTFQPIQGVQRLTGIAGPDCPSCGPVAKTYDANANVTSERDWNGNRTNFTYDSRNLETSRTEGLTAGGAATPATRMAATAWHPTRRLPTILTEPRLKTTLVYNGEGDASCGTLVDGVTLVPGVVCSVTREETTDTNGTAGLAATVTGTPRTWSFTYDAHGQLLTADGPRTDVPDSVVYTYYGDSVTCPGAYPLGCRGMLAATADALGHLTQYLEYDAHGNPLKVVDPNGATVILTYDPVQRLKTRSVAGLVTSYTYDPAGQLTRVALPDASFMDFVYDGAQRLSEMVDSAGNRVRYTMDRKSNRLKEDVYDASSALSRTHRRVYSTTNRLIQDIGAQNQITAFAYDTQGNVTSMTDPLGRVTTRAYDALNRVVKITDAMTPTAGETKFTYDGRDRILSVTDARGLVTTYGYDGFGGITQVTSPDTGTSIATYDAAGNLLSRTDAKGQKTEFSYDALNRPTLAKYADASQAVYTYDDGPSHGIGRLSALIDSSGARTFGYDLLGRLTSESLAAAGASATLTLGYEYDAAGHLAKTTYPSGRTVSYAHDSAGRVSKVQTTLGATTTVVADQVKYAPFGPMTSFKTQGSAVLTRVVDQDGRIASFMAGGKTWNVTYDAASRITSLADAANVLDARTFGYDALGRMVSATTPAGAETYGYDAVGNRTSRGAQTLAYGVSSNRLMQASVPDPRSYSYDANGSPTDDGTRSYEYDARGRLVKATVGTTQAEYVVGSNGARVSKSVSR